jgi:hypothetical protein
MAEFGESRLEGEDDELRLTLADVIDELLSPE